MSNLVLLSGGLDSATLLLQLKESGAHVHALIFRYNQPHKIEVEHAMRLCEQHKIGYTIHEFDLPKSGLLCERPSTPVIEGRNATMISIGAAYACTWRLRSFAGENVKRLYIATNKDDQSLFPDCTIEFLDAMRDALWAGYEVQLKYPFAGWTKSQVVEESIRLGLKKNETWSCYAPDEAVFSGEVYRCLECLPCRAIDDARASIQTSSLKQGEASDK